MVPSEAMYCTHVCAVRQLDLSVQQTAASLFLQIAFQPGRAASQPSNLVQYLASHLFDT